MTLAELTALWREPNAIDKLAEELGQGDKDKLLTASTAPMSPGPSVPTFLQAVSA